MKHSISVLLLTVAGISVGQSLDEIQYGAYIKSSKVMWDRSISVADKNHGSESFEKAMAMYGLLNSTMATKDEETFDDNVDQTVDLLKSIIEEKPDWGEPKAVLSAIYGLVMAYSPMKGMLYGSKSSSLVADALKEQDDSPLVHKVAGGSKLYTPEMFGGNPEEAVKEFERAVSLYEKMGNVANNWLYLESLVNLSMAYKKTEKIAQAKKTLNKALKVEPEYGWAMSMLASIDE
ncbi:MAG: tetratricopeptide repeat protein [Cyclobacteriaceae bacterium]